VIIEAGLGELVAAHGDTTSVVGWDGEGEAADQDLAGAVATREEVEWAVDRVAHEVDGSVVAPGLGR
jgi:hypothetical protein